MARLGIFFKLVQTTIAKSPLFALFVGRGAFKEGYVVGRGGIVCGVDSAWHRWSQGFALVAVGIERSTWRWFRDGIGANVDRLIMMRSVKAKLRQSDLHVGYA